MKPTKEWSIEEVGIWLMSERIHLGNYRRVFEENEVDGKTLLELDLSDLRDIGGT